MSSLRWWMVDAQCVSWWGNEERWLLWQFKTIHPLVRKDWSVVRTNAHITKTVANRRIKNHSMGFDVNTKFYFREQITPPSSRSWWWLIRQKLCPCTCLMRFPFIRDCALSQCFSCATLFSSSIIIKEPFSFISNNRNWFS